MVGVDFAGGYMQMFNRALVPIDGSNSSNAALDCVVRTVGPHTKILLVSVVDVPGQMVEARTPAGWELHEQLGMDALEQQVDQERIAAQTLLEGARSRLQSAGIAEIQSLILEGEPGREIVRAAREASCDLLVMATHGRSRRRRRVLGSVAEHVVESLTDVPILLIHVAGSDDG